MMGEDLGIEAKEAAVREVAKLLPLPELLQSIASIKADYITRQQVPISKQSLSNSIYTFDPDLNDSLLFFCMCPDSC